MSAPGTPLSPRQREVLALLSKGRLAKEVARDLGLHYGTVKEHIRVASRKLRARTTPHAVCIAVRAGLI